MRTRLIAVAAAFALLAAGFTAVGGAAAPAEALSGSDFNPGNIISDAKFFNGQAMDPAGIQNFLNGQVPNCRAGYTCLKSWTETTGSRPADAMCGAYNGAANESAATIIYKVGLVCGVSQKVLLVLLQKEQSLVTDTFPSAGQFRSATGFACPDTAPCDAEYYGFYNQVYKAAWQYKRYTNPPGTSAFFTWYPVGQTSNVRYHPNAACGSSPVVIQNKATAGLYYYTPYQPNAVALSNLYGGQSDGCSSYGNRNFWRLYWDWFGSPTDVDLSPVGTIDSATATLTTATISGWTFDPETPLPVDVHVYVNGTYLTGSFGGIFRAQSPRPDVQAAYPTYGANHGYVITLPMPTATTQFCLYAINLGQGSNTTLGCRTVSKPTGPPIGNIESATLTNNTVSLQGWAIDPDSTASIQVHVYVNGAWGGAYDATVNRPDVARVMPGYGAAHGFSISGVTVPVGTSQVCVYGIDKAGVIENSQLGCKTVSTASGPPKGNIEGLSAKPGTISLSGWTLDPDTPSPIDVHVYVNGAWGGLTTANGARPDVGRVFPGYGDAHGFSIDLPARGGANSVCAYGYNVMGGANTLLGCRTVQVPGGVPFGNVESVSVANGKITVSGWTIDPDSIGSIDAHVYVNDGWGGLTTANLSRPDVARAFPDYGDKHGFQITVPARAGNNRVCVYAINTGTGSDNTRFPCIDVAG
ncbi:hypothetical protein [Herbiconiux ginsengi]|nr:hypothetical protein [Herbiconiux ginsengi]